MNTTTPNYTVLADDGNQYGPVTEAELRDWIKDGRVNPESQVWSEWSSEWMTLREHPTFCSSFLCASANPQADAPIRLDAEDAQQVGVNLFACDCPNCAQSIEFEPQYGGCETFCPKCEQPMVLPQLKDGSRTGTRPAQPQQSSRVALPFFLSGASAVLMGLIAIDFQVGDRLYSGFLPTSMPWKPIHYLLICIGVAAVIGRTFKLRPMERARLIAEAAILFECLYLFQSYLSNFNDWLRGLSLVAALLVLSIAKATLKRLAAQPNVIVAGIIVLGAAFLNPALYPPLKLNKGLFGDASGTMDVYKFPLSEALYGTEEPGSVTVSFNRRGGGTLQLLSTEESLTMFTRWVRKGNVVRGEAREIGKDKKLRFSMNIAAPDRIGFSFSVEDAAYLSVLTKTLREIRTQ